MKTIRAVVVTTFELEAESNIELLGSRIGDAVSVLDADLASKCVGKEVSVHVERSPFPVIGVDDDMWNELKDRLPPKRGEDGESWRGGNSG